MNLEKQTSGLIPQQPRRALWRRIFLPRFSLRTLLVLITLSCIAIVVIPRWIKARNQRAIVEALVRIDRAEIDRRNKEADADEEPRENPPFHHISVIYDDYLDARDTEGSVSVAGKFQQLLDSIFGRDYCHDVVKIETRGSFGNDILWSPEYSKALEQIGKLQSIRELNLSVSGMNSTMLSSIHELKNLRKLNLLINTFSFYKEQAKDLSSFSALKKLTLIWSLRAMGMTILFDYGNLNPLTNIEELEIRHPISPQNFLSLTNLRQLKRLTIIDGCDFSNEAYLKSIVENFPNLEELKISSGVSLNGHAILSKHKKLKEYFVDDKLFSIER